MKNENEIWQVMAGGEVYQADLSTLKEWIGEGLVRPEDRVRKGNLSWIEAARTPALRRVFTGEEIAPAPAAAMVDTATAQPLHHPPPQPQDFDAAALSTRTHALPSPSPSHAALPSTTYGAAPQVLPPPTDGGWIMPVEQPAPSSSPSAPPNASPQPAAHAPAAACHNHPHLPPQFACRSCGTLFCGECVKYPNGTRVAVCTQCDYFCRPYAEAAAARAEYEHRRQGFGVADFVVALKYPFRNLASLLFGAGLYGLLMFAGFRGQVVAYAVMFGCIAVVINKVAYGKLDRDFLPDFSAFNAYEDLFMPILLGCGVTVVTLGPTLLLVVALLFGWFGGQEPPAHARTANAAAHAQAEQPAGPLTTKDMEALIDSKGDPQKEEEIKRKIKAMSPAGQMAQQVEHVEREPGIVKRVGAQLTTRPGLIALLLLLALGWGVFYYPMALAVAGYTEDIWSVVNPLVGLDTIRRMGLTYAKAFGMYVALQAVGLVLGGLVALVTAPFSLPFFGNLPARFIDGALTFYINLVVACVLGLALFKSADRLGIEVD